MKRTFINLLGLCLLFLVSITSNAQQSANTVSYKVTYDASTQLYTTWVIPNYNVPNSNNSGATEKGATAQFTLIVPKDFIINSITDIRGTWDKAPLKMGPGQPSQDWSGTGIDPTVNYYVIGKSATETDYGTFSTGQPVSLFTFKGTDCFGPVAALPPTSPFISIADSRFSLNVGCSFYSRSGQPAGGNQNPLEQFKDVSGASASCSTTVLIVANPDSRNTSGGTSVIINVLGNDTNNGSPASLTNSTLSISQNPTNGTAIINADGTIKYTPNAGFSGTDCYVYRLCDKVATTTCDTAKICVTVAALPPPPQRNIYAFDDNNITNASTPVVGNVLKNDVLATGTGPLVVTTSPVLQPSHGTVVLNANGTYTYTPASGFTGTDSFTYQVCDSGSPAVCDVAIVSINVKGQVGTTNNAPIALSDNAITKVNTSVSGNVMSNDKDPDASQSLMASIVSQPSNGTVVLNANGTYTYTPKTGHTGSDTFTYKVCDNGMPTLCDEAVVNVTITGADINNLPPVANDDLFVRNPTQGVSGNVLTNDTDPNGGTLTVTTTPISNPTNGTVVLNANGTFSYTPNAGYTGFDNFTYQVCNSQSPKQCTEAIVYILTQNMSMGISDIVITKTANKTAAVLNDIITYTVVVKNNGPDMATNIVVKDSLSTGLLYQTASATKGTFTNPTWTIPVLSSGETVTLTMTAKVIIEGVSTNYAKVISQDQSDSNTQNNSTSACSSVPMNICRGDKIQLSVSSTYTDVKWYKDGVMVSSGNVYLATESGTYTMTASNNTCPANGCCPFVVVVTDCCPVNICVPVTISKIIR